MDIKGPTPEVAQQLRFPWKLHLLLERCEYEQRQKHATCAAESKNTASLSDMPISWLPCGKAFKVHDKERFVQEIMPSFFGTQSFKTFQRNLNLWGFTRVSKGPQKDVCSHPLFLKGFPAVCQSMKRIVLKGTGRGNRAPLGGVDVSSVQAVVAAAAMQQAQQQQQQVQQHSIGMAGINNGGINQIPNHIQAQQVLQQQQIHTQHKNIDQQNSFNHFHHQNQHQQLNQQQHQQQLAQNHQEQQFVIENGSIIATPMPSQQKLVVLPSPLNPNNSATTSVMWPNNVNQPLQQQQQQMQQQQSLNAADANANLQKSLQQLSAIIQQLNGCNAVSTAAVNTNSVNNNSNNTVTNNKFQQQQQQHLQLKVGPTPIPAIIQQQQQSSMMQQQLQQQPSDANTVVAPAPMSTQDLVALMLQRNLQQQVCQVQAAPQQVQIQLPTSLFPNGPFSTPQPAPMLQQQQPVVMNGPGNNPFAAANSTDFSRTQQQQGSMMGNNVNPFQQQHQAQPVAAAPSPIPSINGQQQQNQLLQLLLQQNGWATQSST